MVWLGIRRGRGFADKIRKGKRMLGIIFWILFIMIFGRLILFAFKAAWGVTKVLFIIIIFPLVLVGMVVSGLLSLALPLLLVGGVVALVCAKK